MRLGLVMACAEALNSKDFGLRCPSKYITVISTVEERAMSTTTVSKQPPQFRF